MSLDPVEVLIDRLEFAYWMASGGLDDKVPVEESRRDAAARIRRIILGLGRDCPDESGPRECPNSRSAYRAEIAHRLAVVLNGAAR